MVDEDGNEIVGDTPADTNVNAYLEFADECNAIKSCYICYESAPGEMTDDCRCENYRPYTVFGDRANSDRDPEDANFNSQPVWPGWTDVNIYCYTDKDCCGYEIISGEYFEF